MRSSSLLVLLAACNAGEPEKNTPPRLSVAMYAILGRSSRGSELSASGGEW